MKEINLNITIDEANLLLEALGNQPFVKVYALIGKLQEQAGQQLNAEKSSGIGHQSDYPVPAIQE